MDRRLSARKLFTTLPFRYVLFHKPFQVMCQFTPGSTPPASGAPRETLADYVPIPGIYPAGRLDFDSEGLLLLTNDGPLQHRLADPRFQHPRTYWAQLEGKATREALQQLARGIRIQDYVTRSCQVQRIAAPELPDRTPPIRLRRNIPTSWIELTMTEGRNRQIRRMTAAIGFPTLRLVRVALGSLTIDGLTPGSWRDASPQELTLLGRLSGPAVAQQRYR